MKRNKNAFALQRLSRISCRLSFLMVYLLIDQGACYPSFQHVATVFTIAVKTGLEPVLLQVGLLTPLLD